MDFRRVIRHLLMTKWRVNAAFPKPTLAKIEAAVKASHVAHAGQLRFAVEGALHSAALLRGQTARERAIDVFSELRVWDTEHNNGVLIYLLLADRDVEIVADRGIHSRVTSEEWKWSAAPWKPHSRLAASSLARYTGLSSSPNCSRNITRLAVLLRTSYPVSPS